MRVDEAGLHLKAEVRGGRLYCAEVLATESLGYGTYSFVVGSDAALLDRNLVLGLFTWSDSPEYNHREIDAAEISRWGLPNNDNIQVVVQPPTPGAIVRFMLPPGRLPSVHTFTWAPGRVVFETSAGGRIVKRVVMGQHVPKAGGEVVHINLWNMARGLAGDGATDVLITDFKFTPLR